MAEIFPLRPYRYNPDRVSDLGAVIAPPYDVISDQKRAALLDRDPNNVIRLILPEGDDEVKYRRAGELFHQWIESDLLIREPAAALYPYTQTFKHPDTGQQITRAGFVGAVKLEPFGSGSILPHERTLSGPKADRLKLMSATDANLEPIFGIYRDPGGRSIAFLRNLFETTEPILSVTDSDGVVHTLWRLDDAEGVELIQSAVARERIFIVDGHHRYETALNYQASKGRGRRPDEPLAPVDSIMMFLSPTSDPGLLILPTHRVVHSLEAFDFEALLARLGENFKISRPEARNDALDLLADADEPAFLLAADGKLVVAELKAMASVESLVDHLLPDVLRRLDVTILHEHILERLLGISKEAQADQRNLRYIKSTDEALAEAEKSENQLVVIMNATRLEQVEEVAESGSVMPQKSTFFYPKLASGLLFNPLWMEGEKAGGRERG